MLARSIVFGASLSVGSCFSVGRFATRGFALRGGVSQLSETATPAEGTETLIPLSSVVIEPSNTDVSSWSGDMLVLPFWENQTALTGDLEALNTAIGGALADLMEDNEFKGKAGSSATVALPRSSSVRKLTVVGLGESEKFDTAAAKKFGVAIATAAKTSKAKAAAAAMPTGDALDTAIVQSAVEALYLELSPDTRYKSKVEDDAKAPPLAELALLGCDDAGAIRRAQTMAAGILMTRGLVGSPANFVTPSSLAATAEAMAAEFPCFSVKVLEPEECKAMGMGAYLGVAQGADYSGLGRPKFIHMTYTPSGGASKKVALVGKGLTFDSGGYNIKAGAGSLIEKRKFDMGGAGAVFGAARAICGLEPSGVEVHFVVAACENMVSEKAMRPGDILTASNGKTIEVMNTDAEGRLTLADALVYAEKQGPLEAVVDVATLTGACIVALGGDYAGMWSDNDDLAGALESAAKSTGELIWRMPLAAEYKEQIKSPIADIKNLGGPGGGGSITAALFLKEFVEETPWAHLDIAGPVWNDKAGGATGFGVRTLTSFVESKAA